jgi:ornithine carbamoyltransferase
MMNLQQLLTLEDLSDQQMIEMLDLADELKSAKNSQGIDRTQHLYGKNIALVFEKASTRTRCAATVAVSDEGGHAEYLDSNATHLGKKESIADTARVLGRMFDGILFRGFLHSTVEALAEHSGVPVWNGLTDSSHPTQALADLMTIRETLGDLQGKRCVYIGDGRNNVANSLMLACAKAGVDFVNCTPVELAPNHVLIERANAIAQKNNSSVEVCHEPEKAVVDANVLYTDVWVSMGEEAQTKERLKLLRPYQVNQKLVALTGNQDNGKLVFLHCLPAFHNHETAFTAESGALEVTDEVFEADYSRVFDQAENRMHTIKAIMVSSYA